MNTSPQTAPMELSLPSSTPLDSQTTPTELRLPPPSLPPVSQTTPSKSGDGPTPPSSQSTPMDCVPFPPPRDPKIVSLDAASDPSPAPSSPQDSRSTAPAPPPPPAEEAPPPAKKRRRRRKQFPEMIPTNGIRVLRPYTRPPSVYNEKLMDEIVQMQINDSDFPKLRRGRPRSSYGSTCQADELDVEALIAMSVGFPNDSLSEEEIEANVVQTVGGAEQANYIVVRNHILARWRSNVSVWLTPEQAMDAIKSEHHGLVETAYTFLLEHGYINFGLSLAIKEAGWWRDPGGPTTRANVIVIGAGLAGLAASRQLLSLGFKVAVIEGRNRAGGRVLTRKMQGGGVIAAVDLGGSVITGINGNPLGVLARQLGYPLHKVRDKCPLYLPDGTAVDSLVDSSVETAFNQLLDKVCKLRQAILEEVKSVDVSLGRALEAFRQVHGVAETDEERMLLNWHLANLEYANATMLSNLSMAYWDQDDPYEMGGDHCFIPGGNGRFIHALAEKLPIFYGKTVNRIHYGSDGVIVYTKERAFKGDMVLCTVPLGVLKKGSIEFVPALPAEKQDAIDRLGFGLLNKVAMLFSRDFWGGGIDTFGHLTEESSHRGEFFLFYSYSSVSGGPLLIALVAGESAVKFESVPPVEPVERVLAVLRKIFSPKGIEVPDPVQVICTRWGADKFAYGSYSYVAVGASGDDYDVLAESMGNGRVFFAGEATNRRYPATMHGAFLSGLREAANISRACKRKFVVPMTDSPEVIEEDYDLDDLFNKPDLSFGSFSVLYDPISAALESNTLLRVGIDDKKMGSGSLYLYGVFLRKHVVQLQQAEDDDKRLSTLYHNYGTKLVGRNGLGSNGEALAVRIMKAQSGRLAIDGILYEDL